MERLNYSNTEINEKYVVYITKVVASEHMMTTYGSQGDIYEDYLEEGFYTGRLYAQHNERLCFEVSLGSESIDIRGLKSIRGLKLTDLLSNLKEQ